MPLFNVYHITVIMQIKITDAQLHYHQALTRSDSITIIDKHSDSSDSIECTLELVGSL